MGLEKLLENVEKNAPVTLYWRRSSEDRPFYEDFMTLADAERKEEKLERARRKCFIIIAGKPRPEASEI